MTQGKGNYHIENMVNNDWEICDLLSREPHTIRELADALDLSYATTRKRLWRCVGRLKSKGIEVIVTSDYTKERVASFGTQARGNQHVHRVYTINNPSWRDVLLDELEDADGGKDSDPFGLEACASLQEA